MNQQNLHILAKEIYAFRGFIIMKMMNPKFENIQTDFCIFFIGTKFSIGYLTNKKHLKKFFFSLVDNPLPPPPLR